MNCQACIGTKNLISQNICVHIGKIQNGNFPILNVLDTQINLNEFPIYNDYFKDPKLFKNMRFHTLNSKPINSIWFSRGRWIYDPYYECRKCPHKHFDGTQFAYIIQNPNNILEIKTLDELEQFMEKYSNTPESESYIMTTINWQQIQNDYYGISFDFNKVSELMDQDTYFKNYYKYFWHDGYDVASLAIWDLNAFNNTYVAYI